MAKPGEIRIRGGIARAGRGVNVIAAVVRVLKLDERAVDGSAAAGQDPAAHVGHDSTGGGEAVIQVDEIIVLIERNIRGQGIVRPLRD